MNETRVKIRTKLKIIKGRPDLTPLVDVLFLLLIFFILSSSFVEISGVRVDLPTAEVISGKKVGKVFVTVDKHSKFFYEDVPTSWRKLKEQLSKLRSKSDADSNNLTIVIRADRKTPYGVIAKLLALTEKVRLNVVLATVSKETGTVEIDETDD